MWAKMSSSRLTPGAISVKCSPSFLNSNTALSVIYITGWLVLLAYSPLKVICSTSSRNLFDLPSWIIWSFPSPVSTFNPEAVKVPQNIIDKADLK